MEYWNGMTLDLIKNKIKQKFIRHKILITKITKRKLREQNKATERITFLKTLKSECTETSCVQTLVCSEHHMKRTGEKHWPTSLYTMWTSVVISISKPRFRYIYSVDGILVNYMLYTSTTPRVAHTNHLVV